MGRQAQASKQAGRAGRQASKQAGRHAGRQGRGCPVVVPWLVILVFFFENCLLRVSHVCSSSLTVSRCGMAAFVIQSLARALVGGRGGCAPGIHGSRAMAGRAMAAME